MLSPEFVLGVVIVKSEVVKLARVRNTGLIKLLREAYRSYVTRIRANSEKSRGVMGSLFGTAHLDLGGQTSQQTMASVASS